MLGLFSAVQVAAGLLVRCPLKRPLRRAVRQVSPEEEESSLATGYLASMAVPTAQAALNVHEVVVVEVLSL